MALRHEPRLLIVPGLHDSGPAHWQSWLESLHRGSVRVRQDDWSAGDLERWARRLGETLRAHGPGPWIAVAHSFGCLALARWLADAGREPGVAAALLVAPADPRRFNIDEARLSHRLPVPATVIASDTDPWMSAATARVWTRRWGAHGLNLGDAGHINAEAGFGPLPLARRWVLAHAQRLRRAERPRHAPLAEWSFAA
ncbi:RBBP9/YdeN family alpha/beta hydrolase [Caldimonas sp. KR1-144]|uniref:RBBP9/YdeN family alpha/beta hydrolase n=1 Tax=Caldimonas sp. KR1-144 TaxID=3400911 RepID=UPI003BFBBCE6